MHYAINSAALLLFLMAPPPDAAATDYGVFTIKNPTRITVNYQVKWGDGAWKSESLRPGESYHHWHPLDENGRALTPSIRFDYILNDDKVTNRTYRLNFYSSRRPAVTGGKPYKFSLSGYYLDLHSE